MDEIYAKNFEDRIKGNMAIDSRIAFGALIIKEELCLSDEDTVRMIRDNPHCQCFLGLSEFIEVAPFDSSKMVAFRRRFPIDAVARINEAIIRAQSEEDEPPTIRMMTRITMVH